MRYLAVGLLVGLLAAATVHGQTMPSPAEQMLNQMLQPNGPGSASSPTTRPQPPQVMEPVGYAPAASAGALLREGSDVIARRGHLEKLQDNPYSEFIFDGWPHSDLAPMLVLPNLQLMEMEDASAATKQNLHFTVSGLVTEYRGKNFILLESGPDALNQQSPSSVPGYKPAARGPVSADQMLKEMLSADKPSPASPASADSVGKDSTSGSGALPPNAPVISMLPEQAQIFDRVCRLGPCQDGLHQQLTFDADGSTLRDPPLIVLPNLKLADLEKAAGDQHNTRIRATGMVTEYRGRNYILLQKIVVMADSDRQF